MKKIIFNKNNIFNKTTRPVNDSNTKLSIKNLFNNNLSKKDLIKIIIEYLESINISNDVLGIWIRVFHFVSPFAGLAVLLIHSKLLVNLYLFFLLLCFTMFIYLNGCLLSSIEKKLCGNDINIVDIFVELIYKNKEDLNKKRYNFTIIIGTIYIFICLLIYYIRFIQK